jgi:hypothetical protein
MSSHMRRQLAGAFAAVDLGDGTWRLSQGEPPGIDLYLKGAPADAGESLRGRTVSELGTADNEIDDLVIEWGARSVLLTFTAAGLNRSIEAASVIVHEPKPHAYDQLPLAQFEPQARRFWRRVFRVVQLPGGRHLLGVLARRR